MPRPVIARDVVSRLMNFTADSELLRSLKSDHRGALAVLRERTVWADTPNSLSEIKSLRFYLADLERSIATLTSKC